MSAGADLGRGVWGYNWYRLQLKLDAFDESAFVICLTRNRAGGIRFESYASIGDSDQNRHRLYELNKAGSRDIPNRAEFYTFEDYVAQRINTSHFRLDGTVIALDGEGWIGMCALSDHLDEGHLFVDMTGVRADYRQRGISLAMKVLALRWARSVGATSIRTFHHPENRPAIGANEKLGFVPA